MKFLFSILFVIAVQYNLLAESTLPIHITMKSIKTDYIENGASGILISYYVDLRPYFTSTDYSNDTIKKVSISLSTELFKDNKHIKPSKGFENIYYKNKSHLIKKRNTIKLLKFSDYDFITKENALILYEFFVPYAAMNLENGNQNITFNTIATSYARNFKYSESKISNDVSFNKPFTKEVHIYIDSIVAVYGNWDLEILNKGAPDMTV